MAPRLSDADHEMMEAMVRCAKARYRLFESTKAPPNRVGRYKKVTPYKRDALLDNLAIHPTTDRSEMVTFFHDEFEDDVSLSTISPTESQADLCHNDELEPMCAEAGVKLLYLPPYSPDFNPIEEYFAELKNFIKKPGPELSELFKKDFRAFLQACVDTVGKRQESARGHFRQAGLAIDEYIEQIP
ncbi:hypothetical protein FGADI_11337 [Fusarium gaditjirri]|uniref:Tc1-like transposase DDE domain-containing protein n=1 Tax=Fusarium gaditjirri TaxID=282569 RepID=A0A8H4WQK5_9HYPO|nr:hypothetical protein FGADI_11337 [Fusarium gaditjirri]